MDITEDREVSAAREDMEVLEVREVPVARAVSEDLVVRVVLVDLEVRAAAREDLVDKAEVLAVLQGRVPAALEVS